MSWTGMPQTGLPALSRLISPAFAQGNAILYRESFL